VRHALAQLVGGDHRHVEREVGDQLAGEHARHRSERGDADGDARRPHEKTVERLGRAELDRQGPARGGARE
jgi:hypothetical protein